jgi:hypothetical protein
MKLYDYWFHSRRDLLAKFMEDDSLFELRVKGFVFYRDEQLISAVTYRDNKLLWSYKFPNRSVAYWSFQDNLIVESQHIFDDFYRKNDGYEDT